MEQVPAGKHKHVWPWWTKRTDPELEELDKRLAHILSKENVLKQLSGWYESIQLSSFVRNPHALSGRLYKRFLARLYQHRKRDEGASSPKSALCFSSPSSEEDSISLLRFVFHGTPERNLDSILRNGLLRWYRKHGCDWFGVDPKVSRGYCRGDGVSGTLLVFLILPVNRAVADDFGKYILTINCASYQLPIGTVKWVYETEAEPQNQPISEVVS